MPHWSPGCLGAVWAPRPLGHRFLRRRSGRALRAAPSSSATSAPLREGTSRPSQVDPHPRPDPQCPWSQRVPGVKAVLHVGRCVLVRPGGLDTDATGLHHGPGAAGPGGGSPAHAVQTPISPPQGAGTTATAGASRQTSQRWPGMGLALLGRGAPGSKAAGCYAARS